MAFLPKRSVLVPVDFSEASLAAVGVGRELVDEVGHLHVVNVLPALHPGEPGMVWDSPRTDERIAAATEALRKEVAGEGVEGAGLHVRVGHPAHEIIEAAGELGTELIVMPSHGRHGVERLLMGSVTERVLRLATCPVLVLRRGD